MPDVVIHGAIGDVVFFYDALLQPQAAIIVHVETMGYGSVSEVKYHLRVLDRHQPANDQALTAPYSKTPQPRKWTHRPGFSIDRKFSDGGA